MKVQHIYYFTALALLAVSCSQLSSSSQEKELVVENSLQAFDAEAYLQTNCYSCHSPNASHDERLAPPFFAIKKHYTKKYGERNAFVEAFQSFLAEPSDEKAIMRGAVDKFGLMPALPTNPEDIRAVAEYLYDHDIAKPAGHGKGHGAGHGKGHGKHQGAESSPAEALKSGKSLALQTKKVLGKNLMSALQEGGPVHALAFCNTRAIPLTDSMSTALSSSISRVSDQARNPNNQADSLELAIINRFKAALASGEEIKPEMHEFEAVNRGYYPITTNGMCLKCHGVKGKDIEAETLNKIAELYPTDKATGYGINQLRGIWVVDLP